MISDLMIIQNHHQVCMTILDKSVVEDCEEAEMLPECFAASCRSTLFLVSLLCSADSGDFDKYQDDYFVFYRNLTIPVMTQMCSSEDEERCEVRNQ